MRAARLAALCVAIALPCGAADFGSVGRLAQDQFHDLAEDLGAAFSYKGVTPGTSLGIAGFDVGVEATRTKVAHSSFFALAGAGSQDQLFIPKLHVHKGLFGGLDIGAFVAGAPDVHASLYGAELRYALLDDALASPAIAVRLSGTRATGLGALRIGTGALDLVVSKKFAIVTPYAGGGMVRVQAKVQDTALRDEKFNRGRVFGGINVDLVAVNLAFEAEKTGPDTSLSAKIGWRF